MGESYWLYASLIYGIYGHKLNVEYQRLLPIERLI